MSERYVDVRLRQALKARGMDQKRLSELTGLTTRTISELASGKMQRLPKDALAKIADALNIDDMNELLAIQREDTES